MKQLAYDMASELPAALALLVLAAAVVLLLVVLT